MAHHTLSWENGADLAPEFLHEQVRAPPDYAPRDRAPSALFVFNAKTQRRKDAEGACLCERRGNLPASLHSRAASCSGMTPNPPETTPPFAIFAASREKHPRTSPFPIYPTG